MTTDPDTAYAPADLARRTAARLLAAAAALDDAPGALTPSTVGARQALTALVNAAGYSAGILDGLTAVLPRTADPHPTGRPTADGATVAELRAALDRVALATGAPAGAAPRAVAEHVEDTAAEHRERLTRAIDAGQRYADRVDQLTAIIETGQPATDPDTDPGTVEPGTDPGSPVAAP